jgi:[acyl-carrier-protein] S-malonyltransferase
MGADLVERFPVAADTFAEADDALSMDLSGVCFTGPMERLTETEICQPAIIATSVAALRVARELGLEADLAIGHSLGEYAALVAANAMDFSTAIRVVAERGAAMQAAAEATPGGMAALLGLDDSAAETLCERAGDVWPANYNCPGQVVASGSVDGVRRLLALADEEGVRATELNVSGAFHSPHMQPAADRVDAALEGWLPGATELTFLSTTTCQEEAPDTMRATLVAQLTSPVRFSQAVAVARDRGVDRFVELGPGKVLAGLIRRIDRSMPTTSLGTVEAFDDATELGLGPASGASA